MTPKLIQLTNLPRVMLVILPEEVNNPVVTTNNRIGYTQGGVSRYLTLPPDNWRIVSTLSEVTEEWCKSVVEKTANGLGYKGYSKTPTVTFQGRHYYVSGTIDPIESFHSAIEAEGHHVTNPIPVPEFMDGGLDGGGYDDKWIKEYEEAQSKTLPANTLILEMI